MSPLWLITVAAWLVAAPILLVMISRMAREARGLGDDLRRFDEVRPALVRVQTDAEALRLRLRARPRR